MKITQTTDLFYHHIFINVSENGSAFDVGLNKPLWTTRLRLFLHNNKLDLKDKTGTDVGLTWWRKHSWLPRTCVS